jgi:hypothetical protein
MLTSIAVVLWQVVVVSAGDGAGWETLNVPLAEPPQRVRMARLDDDVWPDIAVMLGPLDGLEAHTLTVLKNDGGATFRAHWRAALESGYGGNGIPLAVGDVDADGHADLVIANQLTLGTAAVRLGDGSGTFPAQVALPSYGGWMDDVRLLDVDGDGDLDLSSATYDGGQLYFVARFLGHGDGTFELGGFALIGFTFTWKQVHVDCGDITAAADLDHVVVSPGGLLVKQIGQAGGPSLLEPFARTVVGDFDGNGLDDIAATRPDLHAASVFLSTGALPVSQASILATRRHPTAIVAVDLDLDGDLDLAVCNTHSSSVSLFRNRGDGTFLPAGEIPTGPAPVDLAAGDVDLDGDPDLVAADRDGPSLSVLWNPLNQPRGARSRGR